MHLPWGVRRADHHGMHSPGARHAAHVPGEHGKGWSVRFGAPHALPAGCWVPAKPALCPSPEVAAMCKPQAALNL